MSNLKKKNIIVTGASGGIGYSIVKRLNEAGANILASGTRIEKLEELKKNFEGIKILKFDISQSKKIEEFIEKATNELGGSLDGIVNNAGITQDNLAIRMSLDEWQKVININLTSTFLMSKFAIKKMLKNKSGKIVNITSVVGHTGNLGSFQQIIEREKFTKRNKFSFIVTVNYIKIIIYNYHTIIKFSRNFVHSICSKYYLMIF